MDSRDIGKLLAPYARRLSNMLARGVVGMVNSGSKMQTLQVNLLADEIKDNLEHMEAYGFTSHPHPDAEALASFMDGDRSHGIVICVADRRYRLTGLAAGEVAIYDDLGQKVHLTRAGIVINGANLPVTITNTPKVRMETPILEVTGDVKDRCDTTGKTMDGMRTIYNTHTHPETNAANTQQPNQTM